MQNSEPEFITLDQLKDALEVMGIGRDVSDLQSVDIGPESITVVRRRTNERGNFFVTQLSNSLATVTTEIPLRERA
jgi:hypothetical protein